MSTSNDAVKALSPADWTNAGIEERVAHTISGAPLNFEQREDLLGIIANDLAMEASYLSQYLTDLPPPAPSQPFKISDDLLARFDFMIEVKSSHLLNIKEVWSNVTRTFKAEEILLLCLRRLQEIVAYQQAIQELLEELRQARSKQLPARKKIPLRPLSTNGNIRVPSDRINKATVECLMPGAMKQEEVLTEALKDLEARGLSLGNKFWAAYPFGGRRRDLLGAIGFTEHPGEAIWRLLQRNGALAVKAQYALWARAYAESDPEPQRFITLTISQFCDDLGFKKKKGGHERINKHKAAEVLDLLTSLELAAIYRTPKGNIVKVTGPLWTRGCLKQELDHYYDLFEEYKGNPEDRMAWDPVAFSYAPGEFFRNPEWRAYNKTVALIGAGLLQLGSGTYDKWAVMVGGYIALLARMNHYQPSRISVRRILERTGLIAEIEQHRQAGRMRERLERALERLKLVHVIKCYHYSSEEAEDIDFDNLDSDETLRHLAEPRRWVDSWLHQVVIIEWPDAFAGRAETLRTKKAKRIKAAAARKKRKTT